MVKTKLFAVITAFLILVTFSLTACGGETADLAAKVVESADNYVVIEATATGGSLEDAMKALAEAGELTYDGSESEYGFYLTAVNGREADASQNEYWAVYTTLGEYDGAVYSSADFGTFDYNGKTCASASYGISGIIMVEGELYVLAIATY